MTVGSLFSGIGGLDLGLERAGHRVLWQVESNAYCRRVLARHWPHVPCYTDVTTVTGHDLAPVDLLCGGFPCQPVSQAGHQKGTDDERWLWPEFHRLIDVLRPRYVLLENVPGLFTANGGAAFRGILADLAISGYDAEWDCLPAAAVGAPHLRYRVFLIASLPDAQQFNGGARPEAPRREAGTRSGRSDRSPSNRPDVADAGYTGVHQRRITGSPEAQCDGPGRMEPDGVSGECCTERTALADADRGMRDGGTDQPGRGPERRVTADRGRETLADADAGYHTREDGAVCPRGNPTNAGRQAGTSRFFDAPIGGNWTTEPDVGRVAHGVPHRVDRLKALGNAVVPQVAEWIGRRLNDAS